MGYRVTLSKRWAVKSTHLIGALEIGKVVGHERHLKTKKQRSVSITHVDNFFIFKFIYHVALKMLLFPSLFYEFVFTKIYNFTLKKVPRWWVRFQSTSAQILCHFWLTLLLWWMCRTPDLHVIMIIITSWFAFVSYLIYLFALIIVIFLLYRN